MTELRKFPCGRLCSSLRRGHAAVPKTIPTGITVWNMSARRSRLSMCKRNTGVTQEFGRSCDLPIEHRDGEAVNLNLRASTNRIQLAGANRMQVWYHRAKDNEERHRNTGTASESHFECVAILLNVHASETGSDAGETACCLKEFCTNSKNFLGPVGRTREQSQL